MKTVQSLLLAACALCLSTAAFAQTTPATTGTNTGTTMQNGTMSIPRSQNQSGTNINGGSTIASDGTMGNDNSTMSAKKGTKGHKAHKTKTKM